MIKRLFFTAAIMLASRFWHGGHYHQWRLVAERLRSRTSGSGY